MSIIQTIKEKTENNVENLPSVKLNGQYVKESSFRNPNAPSSFAQSTKAPNIEIKIHFDNKLVSDKIYEITFQIKAHAKTDENDVFIANLDYSGLFTLSNIPDEQKDQVLMIHCPSILFPYACRVMAGITRDGGFQPVMLEPLDFAGIHQQHLAKKITNHTV